MEIKDEIKTAKKYLSKGQIDKCLSICEKVIQHSNNSDYEASLLTLMAQYSLDNQYKNLGSKSITDQAEGNRIIQSIIRLLNDLESDSELIKEKTIDAITPPTFLKAVEARKVFDLNELVKSAKQLSILGYTCVNIIDVIKANLEDAILKNDLTFRLIIIKLDSEASSLMDSHTRTSPMNADYGRTVDKLNYLKENIQEENPKRLSNIQIKYTNWIPSCNLMIVDEGNENGMMQLSINPIFHATPRSKFSAQKVIEKRHNSYWFDLFQNQFENLWHHPDSLDFQFEKKLKFRIF